MPDRLLLRGGCVLDTDPEPVARPSTDILVEDGRIAAVAPNLAVADAEIIDAADAIVLPGLVDTHRHVWQSVLRSAAIDVDLAGYRAVVQHRFGARYRPADLRLANLLGALECLDAGITTVQDFSHIQYSPEHTDAAVEGLRESGIRALFGYGYPVAHPEARRPEHARRARETHFAASDDLLGMGLAPVGPAHRSAEEAIADWWLAEELALPIAVHIGVGPMSARPIELLRGHGLLRPDTLYVHGNSLPDSELRRIAESGAAVAITPAIEARMGHGAPMIGRLRTHGITTGLGVDVVTSVAGDLFGVMRAAWLTSQLTDGPRFTPADLLRLATMDGARTLGMDERIGSLAPGKQADLVLLRTDAVNLVTAPLHDPVGAVVTAAHPGNVDTVLVAGKVRKRNGKLTHPGLAELLAKARETARYLLADQESSAG